MNNLLIKTDRLKLVACDEDILLGLIDGSFGKYKIVDDWITQDTEEALPTFLAMVKTGESLLGWGMWIMVLKGTNLVIGGCGFIGNPDKSGSVEIGYSIAPEYRRKGLTIEACKTLIDWAFCHDEVKFVKAQCEKENIASIKLLEKLGMNFLKSNKKRVLEYVIKSTIKI